MKKFLLKVWTFFWKASLWFFALSIFLVALLRFIPVPITPLMVIRSVQQKMDGKEVVFKKDWVSLEEINNNLQLAVVCAEDQNFLKHNGFDMKAIERAMETNEQGKKLRGGSTISQQTAKNVFCWPHRSWIRKGFEAYFTVLIEFLWSKERIMEVYLNVIEFGDGIYGAEAASMHFFKKHARQLTNSQSAALAVVLPNPRKFSPLRPRGRHSWCIKQMDLWGGKLVYEKGKEELQKKKGL